MKPTLTTPKARRAERSSAKLGLHWTLLPWLGACLFSSSYASAQIPAQGQAETPAQDAAPSPVTPAAGAPAGAAVVAQESTAPIEAAETGTAKPAEDVRLSLDPTSPQVPALPGGLTPAYGQRSQSEGDWRFDFHGFLTAPLVAGLNTRVPRPGQSGTVLHSPPVVPDDRETFSHTGVVPTTYAQLNFSEGNSIVTGHVSLQARQANVSTSFIEPASQLGITDVFLSINPKIPHIKTDVFVGAFTSRYGTSGEYDEGRYGTPLIARINGVGQRVTARIPIGNWMIVAEEGLHGQTNKASASVTPDVWNAFADPNAGSTFVAHGHLGLVYSNHVMLGGHYIRAFSQDDRGNGTSAPDGSIDILAGDLRLTLGRFGHLYAAGSHTKARYAESVSRVISVLNTLGGRGLTQNYLGDQSNGNGTLNVLGGQYDLSIGKLVSYPVPFYGDGPDLYFSVFGMMAMVESQDPREQYRSVTKRKGGVEATYSLLPWLAVSARYDQVDPNVKDRRASFSALSPRIILRTGWQATDQVVLGYTRFFYGSQTLVRVGDPPREDLTVIPDPDMVSLSASMWW